MSPARQRFRRAYAQLRTVARLYHEQPARMVDELWVAAYSLARSSRDHGRIVQAARRAVVCRVFVDPLVTARIVRGAVARRDAVEMRRLAA